MALTSPGVEVTVTDESQYLSAPLNSIPFILLATAQNKANPSGTAVAAGTTAANAGKLFQITSQRDLVNLYGNPFFYSTSGGTPIQGYELNEYGLLAAYSALGSSNRIYCLRADIDLSSLVGSTGRPTGSPAAGTYWLDATQSTWGINEFDSVTGSFNLKTPIVITDSALLTAGFPLQSIGVAGDYAVNAIPDYSIPSAQSSAKFFYKNATNTWVQIGSSAWLASWPTVQGANSVTTLTAGDTITLSISGEVVRTITVPASPSNTLANLVSQINALGFEYLSAASVGNKLRLFSKQTGGEPGYAAPYSITVTGTGTILNTLGIAAATYYQPALQYGTSAQQPLWQSSQTYPRPSGSVWMKIGQAGSGLNSVISQWDSLLSAWSAKTVSYATSDWAAIAALDSTGGKNILAGSIYAQYAFNDEYANAPVYYWERIAEGATVVTGTVASPTFANGPYTLRVSVSVPGSTGLTNYTVSLADNTTAADFIAAWNAAAIPFTTAGVTSTGAIQLSHVAGGVIILDDFKADGTSSGLIQDAGFIAGTTLGVKEGPSSATQYTPVQASSSGAGTGLSVRVTNYYQEYYVDPDTFANAGVGYLVGDLVTFSGSAMGGVNSVNDLVVKVTAVDTLNSNAVLGIAVVSGTGASAYKTQLSNWVEFDMTANEGAPVSTPTDGTNWFYSVIDEVDIMVNTSAGWKGYGNVSYDSSGFPLPSGVNATDPNGPIVSSTEPSLQSDGTALVYGDIWIDTSDLENYPLINRWQLVNGTAKWVRLDNSDQTSATGVVFADARWATSGSVNVTNDPIASIPSLLVSNYLDIDAPVSSLYPVGMLLFNTRRSGYNVKQFRSNYFNNERFPGEVLPVEKNAWVSVSGLMSNGAPYMGRKAQRAIVVAAMKAAIDTNTAIRDEDNAFNLIAAPNYPELQPNMITLNNDRGQTGFIIGDTPMRLPDDATAIQAWATNAAGAASTGEEGLVTRDSYMGLFYPSGQTNDLNGNLVAVPASHMMIRTILRNDSVAYPWFAPAGTRRGIIDNASSIGYIDSTTGEFQSIKTRVGIRDTLYTNQINPLVFFTGNGLLNYGNKTSFASNSSIDRINVARLVAYVRRQLTVASRPFIFEPNDAITREQITGVIQTLMTDLVAKRGLEDYIVVCDASNNTPARIDRNELWVDIGISAVRAVEMIYIPIRLFNTGEIATL